MADKKENTRLEKYKKNVTKENGAMRQSMRDNLSFHQSMIVIDKVEDELMDIAKSPEASAVQVSACTAVLNSKWKRINKILPDLKAVELAGADGGDLPTFNFKIVHE